MKLSNNIKNLMHVLSANIFVMIVGIVQSLLLPSILGPEQYGYWSVYITYIGYAGFFNLGIADGIYLIYGGFEYEDLDKRKFKTYLIFSFIYLTVLCIVACICSLIVLSGNIEKIIMIAVAISSWMQCLISFTVMIDQATSRFAIYSKGHIIEKLSILLGTIFLLITKSNIAIIVIGFSLLGRIATLLYYYLNTKPILLAKAFPINSVLQDIKRFSLAGIWLTLAAIGTTAMTNIGRSFVQSELGITELGYYSFIFSLLALFTLFFSAIATVLFPMMKRTTGENYYKQMKNLDCLLNWLGIVLLLFITPARLVLQVVYPKYIPALHCLVILFPLAILLGKNSMIYFTTYKVERMERQYVYNLVISLIVCIGLNYSLLKIYHDIISPAIATYLSFMIWSFISVYIYNKRSEYNYSYGFLFNGISIVVILVSIYVPNMIASNLIIYALVIASSIYETIKIIPVLKDEKKHLMTKKSEEEVV